MIVHAPVQAAPSRPSRQEGGLALIPMHGITPCDALGHDPWSHVTPEERANLEAERVEWYASLRELATDLRARGW